MLLEIPDDSGLALDMKSIHKLAAKIILIVLIGKPCVKATDFI